MVYLVAVVQHPLRHLVQRFSLVPHVGGVVHQQAVARRGAQGVDDHQTLTGISVLQLLRCQKCVVYRPGLTGGEGDVQHVAALVQQLFEELGIGGHIDLAGLGQLALLQEGVEPGQRLRVASHVVVILLPVHHIGVEQNGNVPALHIGVGEIHGGAAAQCKFSVHKPLRI